MTAARRHTLLHVVLLMGLGGVLLVLSSGVAHAAPEAGQRHQIDTLNAYDVLVTPEQADALRLGNYDITRVEAAAADQVRLEVIMTQTEAAELSANGVSTDQRAPQQTTFQQVGVFRSWSESGGLADEMATLAGNYPGITDLQVIGQSVQGQDILALRVTADAATTAEGERPAVLYNSTQHAREWIAPEVNRRLLRLFLEGYGTDTELTEIVDTRDLYFVLVANPDGYDYTFTEGNRLWRKNLQDNNNDGQITTSDGVDPNRNWAWRWGYDNEGSSPDPADQTFRGSGPASEPETQALESLIERVDPVFMVNYHSAAELILYGVGSQVATDTPDDLIMAALAGDDANPAVDGYDPDLSAELYTTNGETTEHLGATYGILGYTPELSTCQTVAVASDPPCESVFNFPDDEARIEAEFQKNIAFALDLARSADDPFEPDSHIGNTVADFQVDAFEQAHSGTTPVAAIVSRQIAEVTLNFSVNSGATQTVTTQEWEGGERYGEAFDRYYREIRGTVDGASRGDTVEVWFSGSADDGPDQESERFTYTVVGNPANVLVIANENYDGFDPEQPDVPIAQYARSYIDALEDASYTVGIWDMDRQGVPHHLGVLSHYDAVIWYSGQNRLTQSAEDTDFGGDALVDESMPELTVSLRDYLNEGGKLLQTGEAAAYFGIGAGQFGGAIFADNGDPTSPCTNPGTCLIWSDDFHQYYMGAWARANERPADAVVGTADPLDGLLIELAEDDSPQDQAGEFIVTSDVLPADDFPLFGSAPAAIYAADDNAQAPFAPLSGDFYAGVPATNLAYNRLTRTIDLSDVSAADAPTLSFATSYDVEEEYDFFVVEARTDGLDDYSTLPDENGNTVQGPLAACLEGLWDVHPFIFDHYVDDTCDPTAGPTGQFHAFNGSSAGYVDVAFDLSAYAGDTVEVSLAYISDVGFVNTGAVVEDVEVTIGGDVVESEGFEESLGEWAATPPPTGSPATNVSWERTGSILPTLAAAITTEDTVFLPWGLEAIASDSSRATVLARLMDPLTGLDRPDPVDSVTASIDGDTVVADFALGAGFDQDADYIATAYSEGQVLAQTSIDSSPAILEGIDPGVVVEIGVASVVNDIRGHQVYSEPLFYSPEQPDGVVRITGGSRIQGAIDMCQYLVPDYTQARRVLLARHDAFADALAGSPLAGPDACILFTTGGPDAEIDGAVAAEIDRVLDDGDEVLILGGVDAVSPSVEAALADSGYAVTRFAGKTRFETASLIAERVLSDNPGTDALVAYGLDWPDALVGGAYAARVGVPIVLSDTAGLHPAAAAFLDANSIESSTLLGGTAVLSDDVLAAVPGGSRVAGPNRMATAVAIAEELWPGVTNGEGAVFVNAEADDAWIFALSAAPLSAASGEPQLGVRAQEIPPETASLLEGLVRAQVVGDASHISGDVIGGLTEAIGG